MDAHLVGPSDSRGRVSTHLFLLQDVEIKKQTACLTILHVLQAKTQISPRIRAVWIESLIDTLKVAHYPLTFDPNGPYNHCV